ncbi:MAG: hypothetical protein MZV64_11905 [Ignavibacteriales bacterium]|nr:hypothetical protein [Ignavibacteriales bacterium]
MAAAASFAAAPALNNQTDCNTQPHEVPGVHAQPRRALVQGHGAADGLRHRVRQVRPGHLTRRTRGPPPRRGLAAVRRKGEPDESRKMRSRRLCSSSPPSVLMDGTVAERGLAV